jgi:translation initiation factor IF-2
MCARWWRSWRRPWRAPRGEGAAAPSGAPSHATDGVQTGHGLPMSRWGRAPRTTRRPAGRRRHTARGRIARDRQLVPPVGGDRGPLTRARPDRGAAGRPLPAELHDRHGAGGPAGPRGRHPPRPLLRDPAQGRGLLEQRSTNVRALRHGRPQPEARLRTGRLDQHGRLRALRGQARGARGPGGGAGRPAPARAARHREGGRSAQRGPLRPGRPPGGDDGLPGRGVGRRARAGRALGRQRPPGRPAR